MTQPIGPGDWVQAIFSTPFESIKLVQDNVYLIETVHVGEPVGICGFCGEAAGVVFSIFGHAHKTQGVCPCAVRPLRKPPLTATPRGVKEKV